MLARRCCPACFEARRLRRRAPQHDTWVIALPKDNYRDDLSPILTNTASSDKSSAESRSRKGTCSRGDPGMRSECGAHGRSRKPLPGSFGHHLAGTTTGPGGAFPGLGLMGAGNACEKVHDRFGKPVSTFPDHAPKNARSFAPGWAKLTGSNVPFRPRKPGLSCARGPEGPGSEPCAERRQASVLR
jgi:hypothetical protein